MPRNGSGTYSLPLANVVDDTVITIAWANTTMADIATALTGSVPVDGSKAMTGPLKTSDGSKGAPTHSFANETTSGWYRAGTGDVRLSVSDTDRLKVTSAGLNVTGKVIPSDVVNGPDGAVGAPTYGFTNDADTGWYLAGTGDARLAVAGADALKATATAVTPLLKIQAPDGAVGAPAYGFTSDPDTGWYLAADGDARLAVAGADHLGVTTTAIDAKSKKISNVTDPAGNQDAATLKWVTDNFAGINRSVVVARATDFTITGAPGGSAQDVTGMVFSLAANAEYEVRGLLNIDRITGTSNSSRFNASSAPTLATIQGLGVDGGTTALTEGVATAGTSMEFHSDTVNAGPYTIRITGYIKTGGSTSTLQLNIQNGTGSGLGYTVYAGSYLSLYRLS